MKDNNNNEELSNKIAPLIYQLNSDVDINSIKFKLLDFLNEYDIFDVDFITYDDVEEDLSTPKAIDELLNYLDLIRQAEDEESEFTNKLNEIMCDISEYKSTIYKESEDKTNDRRKSNQCT